MLSIRSLQRAVCIALVMVSGATVAAQGQTTTKLKRPALMVMVVVDQLRADYLWRTEDLQGKRGFRYFTDGAYYPRTQWSHFPTYTGPGHAGLSTGAQPSQTGIVANDWFDRAAGKLVYCVDDPGAAIIGGPSESGAKPMGPANLRSTTLGDELKMATGGLAKVVSIAMKDRAAVLMGGRLADAALWYDQGNGRWLSSTAYGTQLPQWVNALNDRGLPASYRGQRWEPLLTSDQAKARGGYEARGENRYAAQTAPFADAVNSGLDATGPAYFKAFTLSPWANQFVFDTALEAVRAEQLGARGVTDLLCISLSSNDYVGHMYGPNSWESIDYTLQTDRALQGFLDGLAKLVPGGLGACTLALSADHGVAMPPKQAASLGLPAFELLESDLTGAAEAALLRRFGKAGLVTAWVEPYIYLDQAAIEAAGFDLAAVQAVAAGAVGAIPGVATAWSVEDLLAGRVPSTPLAAKLVQSVNRRVSGDVIVTLEPGCLVSDGSYATSHGQPYVYDSAVPLAFAGWGIRRGTRQTVASPLDLTPTLAAVAGILPPAGATGQALDCLDLPH